MIKLSQIKASPRMMRLKQPKLRIACQPRSFTSYSRAGYWSTVSIQIRL